MRNPAGALPARIDPLSVAAEPDPYPAYRRMRDEGPLLRGGPAQWVVTRHADVSILLSDARLGNALPEPYHRLSLGDGPAAGFVQRIMLYRDQPAHSRLRRMMAGSFSNSAIRRLGPRIGELADEMLATGHQRGELDLAAELAVPLPLIVACEVLGVPAPVRRAAQPRLLDMGRTLATQGAQADRAAVDEATAWLRDCLSDLLALRRRRPADDLLTRMVHPQDGEEQLTDDEIVDNAVFLLFAGFETTSSLIANGSAALLDHTSELARLRRDRSLLPSAVEEFLRFDPPIQSRIRVVRSKARIGGRILQPGRLLLLMLGSANRDERAFADPDRLDVGRHPNPHLSFGGGRHYCLGASLARLEAVMVFGRILQQFSHIEAAGARVRSGTSALRTYASIPVRVRSATAPSRNGRS